MRMEETASWTLSTVSTSSSLVTGERSVARKEVSAQMKMPKAETATGKSIAPQPAAIISGDEAATTSAAQVDSAYEPKRSEPMPATSPTLSPTLSAIVAGLRGSSSGMPETTLPARSAPTSAALV
jgi:hypothetical protein